jgi:hypothetical protein
MKHDKISNVSGKLLYRPTTFVCLYKYHNLDSLRLVSLFVIHRTQNVFGCEPESSPFFPSTVRPHGYSQVRTEYDGVTCTG